MMKKAVSLVIVIALLIVGYPSAVFASDKNETMCTNEWDIVMILEDADEETLDELEIKPQEAKRIITESYDALRKRAEMPEEQLRALGHSEESIAILKRFVNGEYVTNEELRAASATLTTSVTVIIANTSTIEWAYNWEWSQMPAVCQRDSVGTIWRVVNPQSQLLVATEYKHEATIKYYVGSSCVWTDTNPTFESDLTFDGENVQFEMAYDYDGQGVWMYAKKGTLTIGVRLEESVSATIAYVEFKTKYAHTTFGFAFPSISLSVPTTLTLNFNGSGMRTYLGETHRIITNQGVCYDPS